MSVYRPNRRRRVAVCPIRSRVIDDMVDKIHARRLAAACGAAPAAGCLNGLGLVGDGVVGTQWRGDGRRGAGALAKLASGVVAPTQAKEQGQ